MLGEGLLRLLLAWIVPSTCAACGAERTEVGGSGACRRCWESIRELDPAAACPGCALPAAGGRCRDCGDTPSPISRAAAFGEYEGTLKRLIGAYKFHGFDLLSAPFADRLARVARTSGLEQGAPAVVGVPSTGLRNRQRGFDPGALLARETARRLGLRALPALRRLRSSPPQSRLSRPERTANVAGVFEGAASAAGRPVLLVDDIVTTGATAFAAARALHRAGASRVHLLVLARTPAPGGPTAPECA
jgi:ComF family protein